MLCRSYPSCLTHTSSPRRLAGACVGRAPRSAQLWRRPDNKIVYSRATSHFPSSRDDLASRVRRRSKATQTRDSVCTSPAKANTGQRESLLHDNGSIVFEPQHRCLRPIYRCDQSTCKRYQERGTVPIASTPPSAALPSSLKVTHSSTAGTCPIQAVRGRWRFVETVHAISRHVCGTFQLAHSPLLLSRRLLLPYHHTTSVR